VCVRVRVRMCVCTCTCMCISMCACVDSDLNIFYEYEVLTDPIQITYHIVVIIGGIIILGFSAGFSIRKPKGF